MMRSPRSGKGFIGGLLIIAIGVIFLLDQQGIVSADHVFRIFWPAFIIVVGLRVLISDCDERKRIWGGFLIVGGSVLLLSQLGYIHIRIGLLWPLVLIVVGGWVLLHNYGFLGPWPHPWPHPPWQQGRRGPGGPGGPYEPQTPPTPPADAAAPIPPAPGAPHPSSQGLQDSVMPQDPREWLRLHKREARRQRRAWRHQWASQPYGPSGGFDSQDAQFNYSTIFGHVDRNITARNFKSGSLSAIFGGFEIDLTHADIEGDEAVIYAEAFFGGGEIRIPDTWHVVIEGNALFGAFMDETRQRPPEGAASAKRLIIRGTAVFGGVSIQN